MLVWKKRYHAIFLCPSKQADIRKVLLDHVSQALSIYTRSYNGMILQKTCPLVYSGRKQRMKTILLKS